MGMIRAHYPEMFPTDARWRGRADRLAEKSYELLSFLRDVLGVERVHARYEETVQIDPARLKRRVTFTWATEEEIGLLGAKGMAETRKPDFVFPVDTFVSADSPRENKRFADARIGHGAVVRAIDRSNISPYRHVMRLVELAKGKGIPLQYGMTGGGNDGSAFVPGGAVDIPIAWPLRNSHSAVEIIDERDLDALARLVVAIAEEF